MKTENKKRMYIIDGTALAYKSYFALIKNPLINSKGLNTSAVYGFTTALMRILNELKPDYIACVFDSKERTKRHEVYQDYKATREKMPDEMAQQLPYIEELVKAFNLPFVIKPGTEADDIIASIASKYASKDLKVYMVSADKDLTQIVSKNIMLYSSKKGGETEIFDPKAVEKKFGVPPEKIIDLLSLMGDSSDNIPGVPGVGHKTALKLLEEFGSFENILKNSDRVKSNKIRESLKENSELARLSKDLVTIDTDVKTGISLEDLKIKSPDIKSLSQLFRELEFESLLKKVESPSVKKSENLNYIIVDNENLLEELISKLKNCDFFVFDTETTSLNPFESEIVGISFSFEPKKAYYLPFNLNHKDFESSIILSLIKDIFENSEIKKGGHNTKYDRLVLKNAGIQVRGISFDTMLESHLTDSSSRQHGLDILALKHLNYRKISTESLIGKGKNLISMKDVPIDKVGNYSCEDSDITLRLHNIFSSKLKKMKLEKLYEDVEIPLVSVLSAMEEEGVSVDLRILDKLSDRVTKNITSLETDIFEKAGEEFNINSPKQLSKIIFEKLEVHKELGIKRLKKTKTGYSTDAGVLDLLSAHPIIDKIIEYRNLSKLKSTYLDSLPMLLNDKTGRIHTSFNQTVTATGRLSSSDPNLQNIPIRTDLGKEIRKAFVPKSNNWHIISADYSQVELRILAHLSKDKNLIKTFHEGVDVHTRTASTIFSISDDKVDASLRSRAKAINFGIIYGMGPQRLAKETKISFEEASEFIASYFEKYPGIKKFIDEQISFAEQNEYVTTILGRRREIPEILSTNPRLRINAEHMAVNTPIQGSAADLIKIAMINIHNHLLEERLKTKMIIQVHDELVFESPAEELEEVSKLIVTKMENAIKLDVPIKVDINHGKNWFEAH